MSRGLLSLLLLLIVAGALLFMRLPVVPTYAGLTIENAGHMPLFFLITLAILFVLREREIFRGGRFSAPWLYVVAGVAGLVLGVLTEIIQLPLHRDASWEDVFADAVGTLCALAVYAFFDRHPAWRRQRRVVAVLVVLAGATLYLTPIVNMARAYAHRNGQFPVLADFRAPVERFWTVSFGVRSEIVAGALAVEFVTDGYPGVSFHEPVPDWRSFRTLAVDVENPGTVPLNLGVRVHDIGHGREYSDRFNQKFELAPGERRTLRIALRDIQRGPRGRLMDLQRISDVTLFRAVPEGVQRVRVHGMRLE